MKERESKLEAMPHAYVAFACAIAGARLRIGFGFFGSPSQKTLLPLSSQGVQAHWCRGKPHVPPWPHILAQSSLLHSGYGRGILWAWVLLGSGGRRRKYVVHFKYICSELNNPRWLLSLRYVLLEFMRQFQMKMMIWRPKQNNAQAKTKHRTIMTRRSRAAKSWLCFH